MQYDHLTQNNNNELMHYGVKGMRWGVRKKYYKSNSSYTNTKHKTNTLDRVNVSNKSTKTNKSNYTNSNKAKDKRYKIPDKKSNHRLKLEEKYKKEGLSKDEAEQAAAKRIRTEKFIAGAATMTVAACAAYGVYKYKKYTTDIILDIDTEFQTLMSLNKQQKVKTDGVQYMAYTKKDKKNYLKKYSEFLDVKNSFDDTTDNDIYKIMFKGKQNMKIASDKRARETFNKLYVENKDFKKHVQESLKEAVTDHAGVFRSGKRADMLNDAYNVINSKNATDKDRKKKLYDAFNFTLTLKNDNVEKASKIFFDDLTKQGINAIQDINDKKYSALVKGQNPIIKFNGDFTYMKTLLSDDPEYKRYLSSGKKWFNKYS